MKELLETVKILSEKLPVENYYVRVLYQVYGVYGKKLSHVRPCQECFNEGEGWPCSCMEIVLVPGTGRSPVYSLMHEWGHLYLADHYDSLFAVTVSCKGYSRILRKLMEDTTWHAIEAIANDLIVDYTVAQAIPAYRQHIIEDIMEQLEALSLVQGEPSQEDTEDPIICTNIAALYIHAKTLTTRNQANQAKKLLKTYNCTILKKTLDKTIRQLRKQEYTKAYIQLTNTLLAKYTNTQIKPQKKQRIDPITQKKQTYTCIKIIKP